MIEIQVKGLTKTKIILKAVILRYGSLYLKPPWFLVTSNAYSLPGQSTKSRLGSRSRGLAAVSSGGSELDVEGGDAEGLDLLSNVLLNGKQTLQKLFSNSCLQT